MSAAITRCIQLKTADGFQRIDLETPISAIPDLYQALLSFAETEELVNTSTLSGAVQGISSVITAHTGDMERHVPAWDEEGGGDSSIVQILGHTADGEDPAALIWMAAPITVHNNLSSRAAADAHPISAITGLQTALTDETTARISGDTSAITTCKAYTDTQVSAETTQRTADVSTLNRRMDGFEGSGASFGTVPYTQDELMAMTATDRQAAMSDFVLGMGVEEIYSGSLIYTEVVLVPEIGLACNEWEYNSILEEWVDNGLWTTTTAATNDTEEEEGFLGSVKGTYLRGYSAVDSSGRLQINNYDKLVSTDTEQTVTARKLLTNVQNVLYGFGGNLKLTTPRISGIFAGVSSLDDLVTALEEIFSGQRTASYIKSNTFDQVEPEVELLRARKVDNLYG